MLFFQASKDEMTEPANGSHRWSDTTRERQCIPPSCIARPTHRSTVSAVLTVLSRFQAALCMWCCVLGVVVAWDDELFPVGWRRYEEVIRFVLCNGFAYCGDCDLCWLLENFTAPSTSVHTTPRAASATSIPFKCINEINLQGKTSQTKQCLIVSLMHPSPFCIPTLDGNNGLEFGFHGLLEQRARTCCGGHICTILLHARAHACLCIQSLP